MDKKFLIILIVIFLVVGCFFAFTQNQNTKNQININNTLFTLPEGYH